MNTMVYDYNVFTEQKCAICDKIELKETSIRGTKDRDGWQMAANLPFHNVCSFACADVLKAMLKEEKDKKDAKKKNKNDKSN